MNCKADILLISISAPPKNAPESIQVDRYLRLLAGKYDVTLVTTPPDKGWRRHDPSLVPDYKLAKTILLDFPFRETALKVLRRIRPDLMQMPDGDFWFGHMARRVKKTLRRKPSLIYSRSTPYSSAMLACQLKKKIGVPWVMHLSDPWTDNPFHKYDWEIAAYQQKAEQECFSLADRIALTTEKLVEYYSGKYPSLAGKFFLSNNVYSETTPSAGVFKKDLPLTFVSTGAFYGERNPLSLLRAVDFLRVNSPRVFEKTQFIFAGNIDDHNRVMALRSGLGNVRFLGSVDYAEAVKLQESAHVLVSIDADQQGDVYKVFLPSKILDYMSRRRRVLALTPKGSMTERIMEQGYGSAFSHAETDRIAEHIAQLVTSFEKGDFGIFETPPPLVEYSAKYNADKLCGLFDSLMIRA